MHIVVKGGAFLFPPGEHQMKFWDRVRTTLGEGNSNLNVSVALLEYSEHLGTLCLRIKPLILLLLLSSRPCSRFPHTTQASDYRDQSHLESWR
jgi:hypothetical protein